MALGHDVVGFDLTPEMLKRARANVAGARWLEADLLAPFVDSGGERAFVREHAHSHASYLAAFRAGGLEVLDCLEPAITAGQVSAKRRAFRHIPEATVQA